jgi:hypothetical protein
MMGAYGTMAAPNGPDRPFWLVAPPPLLKSGWPITTLALMPLLNRE